MPKAKLSLLNWIYCCFCLCRSRYNRIGYNIYEYGDTYSFDTNTKTLVLNERDNCNIL